MCNIFLVSPASLGYTYAKNQFIVCLKFSDLPGYPIFYLSTLLLWKPNLAYKVKFTALRSCRRGAQCFPCYNQTQGYTRARGVSRSTGCPIWRMDGEQFLLVRLNDFRAWR